MKERSTHKDHQPQFEFEMKDGKAKRITIESMMIPSAEIARLQEELKKKFQDIKLDYIDWLHVTIGHLGTPDGLFAELQKANSSLERSQFDKQFQQVLTSSEQSLLINTEAKGTELKKFDDGSIVLKLEKQPFEAANQQVYDDTIVMLKNLGIEDPVAYIENSTADSSNLHFMQPDRFQPHITLGKINPKQTIDLSTITPGTETIEFAPTHIYNVNKKEHHPSEKTPFTDV